LLNILSEKRYRYKDLPVEFSHDFSSESNFTFINIEPSAFNRMISNLINNAVGALEGYNGPQNIDH